MSTIKSLLFASLTALSFAVDKPRTETQGGPEPIKIRGPQFIVTSTQRSTAMTSSKEGTYLYEVDLSSPTIHDATVQVSDITDSAQPTQINVVIPAGESSGYFSVEAVIPGDDVLVASNANGSAFLDVTVL